MPRLPRISDYENELSNQGIKLCRNCTSPVSKGRRFYCSTTCLNEFTENHSWFLVRHAILRRDNYRCSICEKRYRKSLLDVDHIIPVRTGIDPFDKKNLRVLCKDCHKAKTALERDLL